MVVLALSALLMTLLYKILSPMSQASAKNSVRVHLQQQGTIALNKLAADLRRSSGGSLSYLGPLTGDSLGLVTLAIHRVEGISASGRSLYEPNVAIYAWEADSSRLVRTVWPPGAPSLGRSPSPDRAFLFDFQELSRLQEESSNWKVLAENVADFSPLNKLPVEPVLKAQITLRKGYVGSREPLEIQLERSIHFRHE